jgi:serine/threonine protein kinase
MLDLERRPHLMDFGLAKREAGETSGTLDGPVLGTPAYMSPEQARGESHHVDDRSGVYSLGVVLYKWFSYLERSTKIRCPTADDIAKPAEIKASQGTLENYHTIAKAVPMHSQFRELPQSSPSWELWFHARTQA